MKKKIVITLFCLYASFTWGQTKTIQERLGYPKDAKLVIIHADDLGVSHSENAASIAAIMRLSEARAFPVDYQSDMPLARVSRGS